MKSNKSSDQFCQNVCYLRKTHHLTQKEMASVLGISVSTLRRIEREDETVRVSSGMLCRLCDHFGLSTDAVLRISIVGDGSPVPYAVKAKKSTTFVVLIFKPNYWLAISFRASLRLKFARPFSSKPMNLTQVMSPRVRTSSTFSTRRFSSLEM